MLVCASLHNEAPHTRGWRQNWGRGAQWVQRIPPLRYSTKFTLPSPSCPTLLSLPSYALLSLPHSHPLSFHSSPSLFVPAAILFLLYSSILSRGSTSSPICMSSLQCTACCNAQLLTRIGLVDSDIVSVMFKMWTMKNSPKHFSFFNKIDRKLYHFHLDFL